MEEDTQIDPIQILNPKGDGQHLEMFGR